MQKAPYPAGVVSARLHRYFAAPRPSPADSAPAATIPGIETIETIIDAAFWASLRREEGFIPRISLAFVSPETAGQRLMLERPLRVDASVLTRVSPAVERAGIHLGVWHDSDGELCVWGTAREIPRFCFVAEVAAAGLIVIKNHGGGTLGKFVNVAVIEGDQIKFLTWDDSSSAGHASLLMPPLEADAASAWEEHTNLLLQFAVSMRSHGRGGSLLVVPSHTETWRNSVVSPVSYAVSPPFLGLRRDGAAKDSFRSAIEAIAGLTAVDGAVVLTDRYEVLGFGAKIIRAKGRQPVERVQITEPIEGTAAVLAHPEQLGGTRHLSAAQFVQDQGNAIALVASQDQRFTVFGWSSREEIVCAHRVEALLL
jgi:hypothetical protein